MFHDVEFGLWEGWEFAIPHNSALTHHVLPKITFLCQFNGKLANFCNILKFYVFFTVTFEDTSRSVLISEDSRQFVSLCLIRKHFNSSSASGC